MISNLRIFGLDSDTGLAQFGGNASVYLRILGFYVDDMHKLLASLEAIDKDNLDAYIQAAHAIKGSSRGVYANNLGDAAEALERAAKNGDFDYISTHHSTFMEDAQRLVCDIEGLLLLAEKTE